MLRVSVKWPLTLSVSSRSGMSATANMRGCSCTCSKTHYTGSTVITATEPVQKHVGCTTHMPIKPLHKGADWRDNSRWDRAAQPCIQPSRPS
jgi:hypothetical protein